MAYQGDLQRIIIEITNLCNLDCNICLRQSWNGVLGTMSEGVFSKLLADIEVIHPIPDVLLGGYGEPLSHPDILDLIRQLNDLGCRTSLITNGTLLTGDFAGSLIDAGLDKLWISTDSFHQQAINFNSSFPIQSGTLTQIAEIQRFGNGQLEELDPGLSMVLAKNNQAEILTNMAQAVKLGIRSFFITNLEAYSPQQAEELNYTLGQLRRPGAWRKTNAALIEGIKKITSINSEVSIEGVITGNQDKCPFAERGELVVRWDGEISPCLPLLYSRTTHIGSWEHDQHSFSLGNISDRSLTEFWSDKDFFQFRERLLEDDFSPCLGCRDCWLSGDNLQDCMGFEHPTCGGCLWAAGLISCP